MKNNNSENNFINLIDEYCKATNIDWLNRCSFYNKINEHIKIGKFNSSFSLEFVFCFYIMLNKYF